MRKSILKNIEVGRLALLLLAVAFVSFCLGSASSSCNQKVHLEYAKYNQKPKKEMQKNTSKQYVQGGFSSLPHPVQ